jgi:hypothetical protein
VKASTSSSQMRNTKETDGRLRCRDAPPRSQRGLPLATLDLASMAPRSVGPLLNLEREDGSRFPSLLDPSPFCMWALVVSFSPSWT